MTGWTYLRRLGWLALAAVLGAGAFNAAIDPYGLFDMPVAEGINEKKVYAHHHARLAKQERAVRLQPRTVVIGNSRVDVGIDPLSAEWPVTMRPVANLGLPGDGMDGSLASFRYILRHTEVRTVVLGLDFMDFLLRDRGYEATAYPDSVTGSLAETLFSLDAIADSVRTIAAQGDRFATAMTTAGFNPMADHEQMIAQEGHFALAAHKSRQNLEQLENRPASVFFPDGRPGEPLVQLAFLLSEASARGVQVIGFVYPFHADFLQSIDVAGRSGGYREWKRALTAIFQEQVAKHSGPLPILWDFGVYASETVEPIPKAGDRAGRMQWWWEPGHHKAALGDRLLRQMVGGADGFGVVLSPDMLPAHLARQGALGAAFRRENRQTILGLLALCPAQACALPAPQKHASRLSE